MTPETNLDKLGNQLDEHRHGLNSPDLTDIEPSHTTKATPQTGWILAFFILAIAATGTAIYIGDQGPVQQFYFRLIIAISIGGIAAIIPGFFDLRLIWFKNSLRGGGAIGVFLLIYLFNPASISGSFRPTANLSGGWNFYLQTPEGDIPGGFAVIEHAEGENVFKITGNVAANPNAPAGVYNTPTITFESEFALITDRKVIFHYRTNEQEEGVADADYAGRDLDELLFNFNDYSRSDKDEYPSGVLKFKRIVTN